MKSFNLTLLFIFITAISLKAQTYQTYVHDIDGKPISLRNYTNVTGSPYLNDTWNKGSIITESGKTFVDIQLKYNIVEDVIYFNSDKNEPKLFVEPVKSFEFDNDGIRKNFSNGFPDVDNFNYSTYYQILYKGAKASLLYKNSKYITEAKAYGSATIEKKFTDNSSYYILRNGSMEKFKPSKKEILALFNDKSNEVNSYLKKSDIDFKNNADLAKVFDFYYSLQ
jgi:hypothetical protein